MITNPNAKINLGLHVTERRVDGYHNLETVFYPIPLQDTIEVVALESHSGVSDFTLSISGIVMEDHVEQNLITRVVRLLQKEFSFPPLQITLHKQIPTGAGLGGGSSDAAHMLRLLNEEFQLGLSVREMEKRVEVLGADCPFFIKNTPVFATGIGTLFTPIELSLKGYHLVLVKPAVSIPTKEAYAHIRPRIPEFSLIDIIKQPIENWKDKMKNDFEASIFPQYPQIAAVKTKLYDLGAVYAAMSGSGATVFGLFRQQVTNLESTFRDCFSWQSLL